MLKESKLEPVIQPNIDIKNIDDEGVEIEFTILTAPKANVKKYKGLKVEKEKVKVTKKEIEEEIDRLRNQYAEIELKEGKIEKGDTAVIDFEGFKDGVAFEGGKGENYPLEIGSNTFIPDLAPIKASSNPGDEVDVNVTFPEDYPSDELKGQAVVFKVKVHEVKTRVLPEINEDLFDDLGLENVNSKEELEKHVEEEIKARKEVNAENKLIDELLEKVAKETEIELEEELVHNEVHRMLHTYDERLRMQRLSLDQYLQFSGKTIDDMENELKGEAEKNITYRYMLEEIANLEKIDATDEEVEEEANRLSQMH